jgi:hypothetical protein
VITDNLSVIKTPAIRAWAKRNKVELCLTPTQASWADPAAGGITGDAPQADPDASEATEPETEPTPSAGSQPVAVDRSLT